MNKFYLIVIAILLSSCQEKPEKIKIPNNVKVENLDNKIEVQGTRILIDKPTNYNYISSSNRFQKSSNNYFQIIEVAGQNYNQTAPGLISKMTQQKEAGGDVRLMEEFKLGDYNAFMGIAPQGKTEQLVMAFGDDSFSTLFIAVYPNNYEDRKTITDIALSTYIDKSKQSDPSENLHYTVGLENSNFKLSSINSTAGIYTLSGRPLTKENSIQDYFVINTMPTPENFDLRGFANNITENLKNNNFENQSITAFDVKSINHSKENKKIEILIDAKLQNENFKIVEYIEETPNGVIQFLGFDFESDESRIEEYTDITQNIRLK